MNKRNHRTAILSIALTTFLLGGAAFAQVTTDIPLYINDNGDGVTPGRDTLYWGVNPSATNGRDAALGEEEQPPAPPEGVFDARWINVGSSNSFGQGVKKNYRAYSSTQQLDTFRLKVQPGFTPGSAGYPITLSWPNMSSYFNGASLRFVDGDGNPVTHDMMSSNTFTFSNPSSVTSTITITTSRPGAATSVPAEAAALELRLANSPNPVTKSGDAIISYTLKAPATVSLELYNGLGQLVATLVDGEMQNATEHQVRLETAGLASGCYHYLLSVGDRVATRSFIVLDR